jgi:phage protein U
MLYMLGPVVFDVAPTNIDRIALVSGQDWAEKPVLGGPPDFEATGAAPTKTKMSGRLFPNFSGGGSLDVLVGMSQGSSPFMLMRGDGLVLGWQIIRNVLQRHSFLLPSGVGRVIDFDLEIDSTPNGPGADALLSLLQGLF